MSLLERLPYAEWQSACNFTGEICNNIALLANINISYNEVVNPGKKLLNDLNRRGYSVKQYRQLLSMAAKDTGPQKRSSSRPQIKVAILICNDEYKHLSKLATPSLDCEFLANTLRSLGYIAVTIKNVTKSVLLKLLDELFKAIPADSYCFIFYAGHGFEFCNVKYITFVDSPSRDMKLDYCLTESCVLDYVSKCHPALCVFIMDMCSTVLDRESNPDFYKNVPTTRSYNLDGNLFIVYTTQSESSAYEMVQIQVDYSQSIDNNISYELKPGDTDKVEAKSSQYVMALCQHIERQIDVGAMLDMVHEDLENAPKKQKPIKIQSGVSKRSLHDKTRGDVRSVLKSIRGLVENEDFKKFCDCY